MDVKEALAKRQSIRAYRPEPVAREVIERILEAAGKSPSGVNMQPWEIVVVQGQAKDALCQKVEKAFLEDLDDPADYQYYPEKWIEPFKSRRMACGLQMYEALGIERKDKERRKGQWAANYRAFDAPVVIYFLMKNHFGEGTYLDFGMFIQSIALAAVEEGLGTCIQAALADYPTIVKEAIGYADKDHRLVCGMALGYPDMEHPSNTYRTPREPISAFTTFID